MLYVLMYPEFAPEVGAWINGYRMVYEPARAKMVAPHVTLVFGVKQIAEPALVALCEDAARRQKAFDVSFAGTRFEPDVLDGTYKGYLDIEAGAQEVRDLHHALYQGPHANEYHHGIEFVPHVTIATLLSEGDRDIAMERAKEIALPIIGQIRAITVVRLLNDKVSGVTEIKLTG